MDKNDCFEALPWDLDSVCFHTTFDIVSQHLLFVVFFLRQGLTCTSDWPQTHDNPPPNECWEYRCDCGHPDSPALKKKQDNNHFAGLEDGSIAKDPVASFDLNLLSRTLVKKHDAPPYTPPVPSWKVLGQ